MEDKKHSEKYDGKSPLGAKALIVRVEEDCELDPKKNFVSQLVKECSSDVIEVVNALYLEANRKFPMQGSPAQKSAAKRDRREFIKKGFMDTYAATVPKYRLLAKAHRLRPFPNTSPRTVKMWIDKILSDLAVDDTWTGDDIDGILVRLLQDDFYSRKKERYIHDYLRYESPKYAEGREYLNLIFVDIQYAWEAKSEKGKREFWNEDVVRPLKESRDFDRKRQRTSGYDRENGSSFDRNDRNRRNDRRKGRFNDDRRKGRFNERSENRSYGRNYERNRQGDRKDRGDSGPKDKNWNPDWKCEKCGAVNWGSKRSDTCFKCGAKKPNVDSMVLTVVNQSTGQEKAKSGAGRKE